VAPVEKLVMLIWSALTSLIPEKLAVEDSGGAMAAVIDSE
jgi:hypothetical protein